MIFDEADSELLKKWIIAQIDKLEDSEADSDVLADYVLALVKTDEPETVAKANCNENLTDFLGDGTERFVDELFAAIRTKHYDLSAPPPKPTPTAPSNSQAPPGMRMSKKRGYRDWDSVQDQGQYGGRDRPMKQPRRGGREMFSRHMPPPPTRPPGMPAFDPSNPLASLFAMQQMMGLLPPDFDLARLSNPANRCRDYDVKGFCTRGAHCPFEHGEDPHIITGNEYDPNQPPLLNIQPTRTGSIDPSASQSRGRGRGGQRGRGGSRGSGNRSGFSRAGPNYDKTNTSIVVEQIPQDNFDEQAVRDFFGEFGNIEHVAIHKYKRTAVVKFDSWESAKAAWVSPKSVFENRHVKVYWFRGDNLPKRDPNVEEEEPEPEPELDLEEVARKQEEAQRRYEEKKRKLEEAARERQAIEMKVRELHEKKQEILAKVAEKEGTPASGENESTQSLRAQLAQLEEEAKALGIDPNAATSDWRGAQYHPRGRGGFRGRPRGRAGHAPSFRGGWPGGAVIRLDNRPKTVCLIFRDNTYEDHEEVLRSHLLFNGSEANLENHPDRIDAALVSFAERYLAENFMVAAAGSDFPLAGKADLSWYKADPITNGFSNNVPTTDSKMEDAIVERDAPAEKDKESKDEEPPRDLDVADVDDRWG